MEVWPCRSGDVPIQPTIQVFAFHLRKGQIFARRDGLLIATAPMRSTQWPFQVCQRVASCIANDYLGDRHRTTRGVALAIRCDTIENARQDLIKITVRNLSDALATESTTPE